jgi:hypothetical protein
MGFQSPRSAWLLHSADSIALRTSGLMVRLTGSLSPDLVNSSTSVSKGDRILVAGKLRVRDWDNGERAGTSVEIEAESIGHDLSWGSAVFTRTVLVRETEAVDAETLRVDAGVDNSNEEYLTEPELVGAKKK